MEASSNKANISAESALPPPPVTAEPEPNASNKANISAISKSAPANTAQGRLKQAEEIFRMNGMLK